MSDKDLQWQVKNSEELCKTPVFTINTVTSVSPDNNEGKYIVLDAPDWVITIPVLTVNGKRHFLLVKQWRHGANKLSIEFPGGVINKGEEPSCAALRELAEETGYTAKKLKHLKSVYPNPAIMSNKCHFFLAEELTNTEKRNLDKDEYITVMTVDEQTLLNEMGEDKTTHALMSTALFFYLQSRNFKTDVPDKR